MFRSSCAALLAATLAACTSADNTGDVDAGNAAAAPVASATLLAPDGSPRGSATLTAAGDGLELHIAATNLPAGPHGLHLHAIGKCDAPDFTTAGPHLNPHAKQHGTENPQGTHLGDLPNLVAGADGKAALTARLGGTRAELDGLLFDADGTAIVVHATADDYRTDPSGNSGARIACGTLTRG